MENLFANLIYIINFRYENYNYYPVNIAVNTLLKLNLQTLNELKSIDILYKKWYHTL